MKDAKNRFGRLTGNVAEFDPADNLNHVESDISSFFLSFLSQICLYCAVYIYPTGEEGQGEMPSRSSTAEYPLQTLSHRSSLNFGSLSKDRLEPEAGPSNGGAKMTRGNSGRRSKKRLSDGGDEENEALLGDGVRGFEDDTVRFRSV